MSKRFALPASALTILILAALPLTLAFSKSRQVTFSLGPVGLALQNGELLVAARLNNTSDRTAFRVQIRSITLTSAALSTPTSFPVPVGEIDSGENAVIQAAFDSSQLAQGQQYVLRIHGSYRPVNKGTSSDQGHVFTVSTEIALPPPGPGSAALNTGSVDGNSVSGAPFPPIQLPDNFDEANEAGPPVPTGPPIPLPQVPDGTHIMMPGGTARAQPNFVKVNNPDPPVIFSANDSLNLISGGFNGQASTVAEPSGASNGHGVIFATANWTAAYSTNGGGSFTQLNPTTIFPNDAIGYCCDQVVQYVPSINRFIWLLQGNGYRIASASPATVSSSGGTAWTYWNLTPAFFGLTGSLDYPDMSVGDNFLYLSFDRVGTGLMVVRISLAQIQAGGTIFVEWTDPNNGGSAYGGHVMQDTGNEVFWAGHNSTSQMRIFSLAEGSNTYFWRDRNISSWSNTGLVATTPDGRDWMTKLRNFPGSSVIGATRAPTGRGDGLWFAWSAGTDNNFRQPHVEIATFDRSNNFNLVQQVQIWNNSYPFAYPSLATNNCTSEVGFSLEGGDNPNYENHLVGFWGDFIAYIMTGSNVGTTRYGDYVTIRQDPGTFGSFDAFGYGLEAPSPGQSGTQTDVRYEVFGRSCQTPG